MRPLIRLAEPDDFSAAALSRLRELGDVVSSTCPSDELASALRECDVFWFRLGHRIGAAELEGCRCRIIACPVTGLDHIDESACARAGVRIVSLRGEREFLKRVRATAELTIGLALALLRNIPDAAASVKRGEWNRDAFRGRELYEKTAGVVGLGRLGTIVSEYLHTLGMNVLGYDPSGETPAHVERVRSLEELFSRSDLVTLHVRYDDSTHHLIGSELLSAMRPNAVLVNTSRGGVIDETALNEALRANALAGAALDVLEGEDRVTADRPLIQLARAGGNLIIVPHIGGNTEESFQKTELFLAEKLAEVLREVWP